jgi:hypothetical protein
LPRSEIVQPSPHTATNNNRGRAGRGSTMPAAAQRYRPRLNDVGDGQPMDERPLDALRGLFG